MKVSSYCIKLFTSMLTTQYKGEELVSLFNETGFILDFYSWKKGINGINISEMENTVSKSQYVQLRLNEMNGTKKMEEFLRIYINKTIDALSPDLELSFIENINDLLIKDNYSVIKKDIGIFIKKTGEEIEKTSVEAHFEDIKNKIIKELSEAQISIWVAVAWFTDRNFFETLLKKKKEGLSIRIIIADDENNKKSGLDFENHFEFYQIEKWGKFENMLHNKFCIIDSKKVIAGSFNWSVKASFNEENIDIVENRDNAESYSKQFIKLIPKKYIK